MEVCVCVNVYTRENNPVSMVQKSGSLFEKLDEDGNPTGSMVNLKVALDCRAYFNNPANNKRKG